VLGFTHKRIDVNKVVSSAPISFLTQKVGVRVNTQSVKLTQQESSQLFRRLFKPCGVKDYITQYLEGQPPICSGFETPRGRNREGCRFCSLFVPNIENWDKEDYPEC